MSDTYQTRLVEEDASTFARVTAVMVGIGFLTFIFGLTALFEVVRLETSIFGITAFDLFGIALLAMGGTVLALGVVSRSGFAKTTPSDTAGVPSGILLGLIGFSISGLVASQTFGLGGVGWFLVALLAGGGTAAVTVLPREDIGSTVPIGAFAFGAGVVLLTGIIGPEWIWKPNDKFEATVTAGIAVPILAAFCSVLCAWVAAKAHDGFGSRGRQTGAYLLMGLNAFMMLGVLCLLIAWVVKKGLPAVTRGIEIGPGLHFEWPFVMNVSSGIYVDIPGVLPAIMGTVWIVIGTVIFAVPLGVGAALYLTEYAEQGRFTQVVEIATNGLWSTPSIVFGLFGLAFLVPRLGNNESLLAGILVLGFMLLPLVLITSREAIKAVPDEYRDASAALGVNKWETIRSVVLPAALPGIITGVILGVGRIAGETAPLLLVLGGQPLPSNPPNVLGSFRFSLTPPFVTNDALLQAASALPYQLYATITAGVAGVENKQAFGWGTALVLLLVVLSFYAIGIASRAYFRRKLHQ
jgi:phosphate transport system permease protein